MGGTFQSDGRDSITAKVLAHPSTLVFATLSQGEHRRSPVTVAPEGLPHATRNECGRCRAPTWFKKKFKKAATPNPVALALLESNPAAASFPHS